jgi:hypothetical protein
MGEESPAYKDATPGDLRRLGEIAFGGELVLAFHSTAGAAVRDRAVIERWISIHDHDGIAPAGWPSAEELPKLALEEMPAVEDLSPAAVRRRTSSAPSAAATIRFRR